MQSSKGPFRFSFTPLLFLDAGSVVELASTLSTQCVPNEFNLLAIRRRQYWSVTLPMGAFANDFRPGVASYISEAAALKTTLERVRAEYSYQQVRPDRTIVTHDGETYYHQHLIGLLRHHVKPGGFFQALHTFLGQAQENPALIRPRGSQSPFVPFEQRTRIGKRFARGPAWSPEEDTVLRQWFGIRTTGPDAGHHAQLSRDEWAKVLEQLQGRRTESSVRQRIHILNQATMLKFIVNGYVPRDRVRAYMQEALGEAPRYPRVSPSRITLAKQNKQEGTPLERSSS